MNVERRTILSLGKKGGLSRNQELEAMRLIESHGGWLFRSEIEGVWASFPTTFSSLCATCQILRAQPDLMAGLHRGEITLTADGDLLGNTLSVAKRLETTVQPGAVHLLPELLEEVEEPLYFARLSEPKQVELKNLGVREAVTITPTFQERERAFKFLDSFGSEDRDFFFGREVEVEQLFESLEKNRWVTLFGPSGVGKSSVVGAGLFPRYHESGYQVRVIRSLERPLATLEGIVAEWKAGEAPGLFICLDQFEEFFLRISRAERQEFWRGLQLMLEDQSLRKVRWLFSLRQDFLAELGEAEEAISGFLDSRLSLSLLTREQARLCILGPTQRCGRWVEESLVERILDDLFDDGIDPPELQIVLDRLDTTREPGSSWLTQEAYDRLGGFREILVDYLYEVLERIADTNLARRVLLALVTEEGTKRACDPAEIAPELESEKVEAVLRKLLEARLLRRLTEAGLVELSHEYLIKEIQGWANEAELAAKYARATLEDELDSWNRLGSLMEVGKLHFLNQQVEAVHPNPPTRQLLLRANLVYGVEPSLWLKENEDESFLLGLLDQYEDGDIQRRLIAQLYELPLSGRGLDRLVQAARRYGNPGLLKSLGASESGRLEALEKSVFQRFLGPQKMVKVPAGSFLCGSTAENKAERKAELHPYLHPKIDSEVELQEIELEDFWIDICPVTNREFAEFDRSHKLRYPEDEGNHPVVSVTLMEAQSYAAWLGKELPTEYEWEKAARGGDGRLYPWGSLYDPEKLNSQEGQTKQTTPVDHYPSGKSPYGCLDMAGNVWEWTQSKWAEGGPFVVQKGGSTLCSRSQLQCSSRMDAFPDFVLRWTGFRLKSSRSAPGVED